MQLTKKLIGLLAIASILLLAGCATAAVQAAPAASGAEAPAATPYNGGEEKAPSSAASTVQGQGTVSAKPDLVTLSLGVQTTGETAMEALGAQQRADDRGYCRDSGGRDRG